MNPQLRLVASVGRLPIFTTPSVLERDRHPGCEREPLERNRLKARLHTAAGRHYAIDGTLVAWNTNTWDQRVSPPLESVVRKATG